MADSSVELIEFFRPYKNEVNLYVTNISRRLEKDVVQVRISLCIIIFNAISYGQKWCASEVRIVAFFRWNCLKYSPSLVWCMRYKWSIHQIVQKVSYFSCFSFPSFTRNCSLLETKFWTGTRHSVECLSKSTRPV